MQDDATPTYWSSTACAVCRVGRVKHFIQFFPVLLKQLFTLGKTWVKLRCQPWLYGSCCFARSCLLGQCVVGLMCTTEPAEKSDVLTEAKKIEKLFFCSMGSCAKNVRKKFQWRLNNFNKINIKKDCYISLLTLVIGKQC